MTEAGDADATHQGNLTGDMAGDAFGMNGLDGAGPGVGGGGHNESAIGTGRLNTLGNSAGCAAGEDCRYGQTRGTNPQPQPSRRTRRRTSRRSPRRWSASRPT